MFHYMVQIFLKKKQLTRSSFWCCGVSMFWHSSVICAGNLHLHLNIIWILLRWHGWRHGVFRVQKSGIHLFPIYNPRWPSKSTLCDASKMSLQFRVIGSLHQLRIDDLFRLFSRGLLDHSLTQNAEFGESWGELACCECLSSSVLPGHGSLGQTLKGLALRQADGELLERDKQGQDGLQSGSPRPQTEGTQEFEILGCLDSGSLLRFVLQVGRFR